MESLTKWIEAVIITLTAIFAPVQSLLLTTGIMIFVDLITGILSARKRGESVTSAGLRRSISKLFVYELTLIMAFLAEKYMSDILPFVKMASGTITLVEMKSIYENLNVISGGELLKGLINTLGSVNQKIE